MHLSEGYRRRMPTPAPKPDDTLALLLDEVWDLNEAIEDLERRRERIRDHILSACRASRTDRLHHVRGALRIDRYESYKVTGSADVLRIVQDLRWEDKVLAVKGRALYQEAQKHPTARALFSALCREVQHEVLVLSPTRKR